MRALQIILGFSLRSHFPFPFPFRRTLTLSVPTTSSRVTAVIPSTPFSLLSPPSFFNKASAMSTLPGDDYNNKKEEEEAMPILEEKIQAVTPQQQEQHDDNDVVDEKVKEGDVDAKKEEDLEEEEEKGVEFAVSATCTLKIVKGDITQWSVDGASDAIVNAANERMLGGGGVDGAIHRAAGRELKEACYRVPEVKPGVRCPTGEARITPGFRLPAAYVIHTVGPVYDEDDDPEILLQNAYRNSLRIAKEHNIQYIAFPAISCGIYGYPFDEAAAVAISTVKEFADDFKEVHFVLFSDDIYEDWLKKGKEILE